MPLTALALVLGAALLHATWNLAAKRAAHATHFMWLSATMAAALYLPVVGWILLTTPVNFGWREAFACIASAVVHFGYNVARQTAYRVADFSVVYPIARGSGPLLSFTGAILLLGEKPSLLAFLGLVLIVFGVLAISGGRAWLTAHRGGVDLRGVLWGLIAGAFVAGYTVIDGWAVRYLLMSPFVVDICGNLFASIVLARRALREPAEVRTQWRQFWPQVVTVATLGPIGYIAVLFAMKLAPVSHVAPAREVSMMIGAFFGAKLLQEGDTLRRVAYAALIAAGVVCLAWT
ncbi:MAG: EamA family transporter [Burkholderiales bacterium]|nr:EamA family transporter [Burkholderiales bacterium]